MAAGSFVGTFALIFAAIAALWAIDTLLAEKERAESRSEARHMFQEALILKDQGRELEALDRLSSAHSMERDNATFQRALAQTLLATGKIAECEALLTSRLQQDPTDAAASLIMARALVAERKIRQAIAFYHRAIYGEWEDDRIGNRVQARFELVDLLARENAREELLAELLPLQDEAPNDVKTRERIARLFIAAGSPLRASEIFQDILRRHSHDAEAYAGLGEAELQRGNYRAARADFLMALKMGAPETEVAARLSLCNQVLALDPTQRGIGTDEQYRRSQSLVQLTLRTVSSCTSPAAVQSLEGLADTVKIALLRQVSRAHLHDAVEKNLDLAERLWQIRMENCSPRVADSNDVLRLVMEKAAQ
jgi:tetratricopeptide (TPR) repeat protein